MVLHVSATCTSFCTNQFHHHKLELEKHSLHTPNHLSSSSAPRAFMSSKNATYESSMLCGLATVWTESAFVLDTGAKELEEAEVGLVKEDD